MKKKLFAGLAVGLMMFGVASLASANLITNGSFEGGINVPTGNYTTLYKSTYANEITGWTLTRNTVDWINSYWSASDGSKSLDLSGTSKGTIVSAQFSTVINALYNVSFDMAGNTDGGPRIKTLQVTVDPLAAINIFSFDTIGKSHKNMGWTTNTFSFTATSAWTTLSFSDLSENGTNDYYGAALDNVIVGAAPVPEPTTMLLLGAGLVGLVGVRRKK